MTQRDSGYYYWLAGLIGTKAFRQTHQDTEMHAEAYRNLRFIHGYKAG